MNIIKPEVNLNVHVRRPTLYLDKCTWRRFLFRFDYNMLLHYSIPLSDNVDSTHGYSLSEYSESESSQKPNGWQVSYFGFLCRPKWLALFLVLYHRVLIPYSRLLIIFPSQPVHLTSHIN